MRGWPFPFFILVQANNMSPAKQIILCLFSDSTCESQSAFALVIDDFGRRANCQGRYHARCDAT